MKFFLTKCGYMHILKYEPTNFLLFLVFFYIKFNSTVSLNLMIIYSAHLNLKAVRVNFYARIFSTPSKVFIDTEREF